MDELRKLEGKYRNENDAKNDNEENPFDYHWPEIDQENEHVHGHGEHHHEHFGPDGFFCNELGKFVQMLNFFFFFLSCAKCGNNLFFFFVYFCTRKKYD